MIQAIASNYAAGGAAQAASSPGVLEAQLNRYQVQLADWCNCPSGKTPEGKAIIQSLQDKADAIKAQIEQSTANRRPPALPEQNNANPIAGANGTAAAAPAAGTAVSAIGGFVNTFA